MTPSRRDFLAAAAATTVAGSLPATPVNRKPAKSCIFLHLVGGPSQLDTFDPKPMAPSDVRGPFNAIQTAVPGVHVSELFPRLAGLMNDVAMIRTVHHDAAPIHENGFQLLHTGRRYGSGTPWPGVGTVVAHLRSDGEFRPFENMLMPSHRIHCGIDVDLGQDCGWLTSHNPNIYSWDKGRPDFLELCRMAFAYSGHPETHVVVANMYDTVFDTVSWDCHADNGSLNTTLQDYRESVCPEFDLGFSSLISSLKRTGRLDETLVVAVGEFGRTPKLNAQGGRDHWPGCWTALLAGGGIKGGRVIGESDATASAPKDRPVTCPELLATIYHALGIPSTTTIPGPDGKPVRVVEASPVLELF